MNRRQGQSYFISLGVVFSLNLFLSGCFGGKPEQKKPDLVIYGHESFVSKGGLGPAVQPLFEAKCQCKIQLLAVGDAAQILAKLELDSRRGKSEAQLAVGFDQYSFERAKNYLDLWPNWTPALYEKIPSDLKLGKGFLPYDFGLMTFMSDQTAIRGRQLSAPGRLKDLLFPEWKKSVLLEDPRTSTPGLIFLLYTQAVLGKGVWKFWEEMRFQWRTLAPGWSGAYQLFMKAEAPLVWSYFSSQAYHRAHGDTAGKYQALTFEEGHPIQVEGAALIKNGFESEPQKLLAMSFLEFLLTAEVQKLVMKKNWMMPVMPNIQYPAEFQSLPQVKNRIQLVATPKEIEEALLKWGQVVSGSK